MQTWQSNPAFGAYLVNCLILVVNLLVLWAVSGGTRAKTKTVINEEDTSTVSKGARLLPDNPPEVARVLRVHQNAMANVVPFLFLAQLFVAVGGPAQEAWILFSAFTGFRLLHSVVYLAGKQPWRTIFFTLGGLTTIALMIEVVRLSLR